MCAYTVIRAILKYEVIVMTYNEARKKATLKYTAANIHRIPLNVQNEEYERIKAAATAAGESVNGYIKSAIRARMESESQ